MDSCEEIKSAPSVAYVTKSGRVWRKVPESDARGVILCVFLPAYRPAAYLSISL